MFLMGKTLASHSWQPYENPVSQMKIHVVTTFSSGQECGSVVNTFMVSSFSPKHQAKKTKEIPTYNKSSFQVLLSSLEA